MLSGFLDSIFEDSMHQSREIVCSSFRIMKLKERDYTNQIFIQKVSSIFNEQELVTITQSVTKNGVQNSPRSIGVNSSDDFILNYIRIEQAKQYKDPYLTFVIGKSRYQKTKNLFKTQDAPYNLNNEHSEYYYNYHSLPKQCLETGVLHHIPQQSADDFCKDYYLRPIPNSSEAKSTEITNFSKLIAVSLRRLKMYQSRLPILETQISSVLSFESTLKKMKSDYAFDMLDPLNTEAKIKEYDNFFNQSLKTLNDWKKGLATDVKIDTTEISKISEIL